jgi:Zn-finger nucleic acid-binding protein
MRVLVACPECARQFDASGRPLGSRFRCLCGRQLAVAAQQAHDAAVIRCSSCGAPREQGAAACAFCAGDFTLHERELHTICPACMARVSDRARYCHHCATPLLAEPLGPLTKHSCPACGDGVFLTSRSLGDDAIPILECQRCAGLWLGRQAFSVVMDRARRDSRTEDDREARRPAPLQRQSGALYRPCPECGVLMHRRNYGRRSGVIVDSCTEHGIWFDARELDELLLWVRRGGEAATLRRQEEEGGQLERQRRLHRDIGPGIGTPEESGGELWLIEAFNALLGRFLG